MTLVLAISALWILASLVLGIALHLDAGRDDDLPPPERPVTPADWRRP